MLQQENRLKKARDFNLVMEHGRWVNGRFLDAKIVDLAKIKDKFPKKVDVGEFKNQLKIAISVGVKVSKSAVKRNRARRQISECVRLLIKEGGLKTGFYVLIAAKKDVLDKEYEEIAKEVGGILKKAGLFV